MWICLLGFFVGQEPNEQIVSNRIICHVGFGQQSSIVFQVLTMDENVHACPLNHACILNVRALPNSQFTDRQRQGCDKDNMRAAYTTIVVNIAHTD
jgi:DNA-binding transcriptional LysR family regulator